MRLPLNLNRCWYCFSIPIDSNWCGSRWIHELCECVRERVLMGVHRILKLIIFRHCIKEKARSFIDWVTDSLIEMDSPPSFMVQRFPFVTHWRSLNYIQTTMMMMMGKPNEPKRRSISTIHSWQNDAQPKTHLHPHINDRDSSILMF